LKGSPAYPDCRVVNGAPHPVTGSKVVCTVAHLDHVPENCDPANLRFWCQRCHNTYDRPHRQRNADAKRRAAKTRGESFSVNHTDMVREFHEAMDLPARTTPDLGTGDERALRVRLIMEETRELIEALFAGDIVAVADALADLDYVVQGTAVQFGIPQREVFAEVHRSNMTKRGGVKDAGGKLMKPAWYERPNLEPIILQALSRPAA
jgi:predicted HAD superfamily Cof-like phosphohydrolase